VDAFLYTQELPGEDPFKRWELWDRKWDSPLPSGDEGQTPQFRGELPAGAAIYVAVHNRDGFDYDAAFVWFRINCTLLAVETTTDTATGTVTATAIATGNAPTAAPTTTDTTTGAVTATAIATGNSGANSNDDGGTGSSKGASGSKWVLAVVAVAVGVVLLLVGCGLLAVAWRRRRLRAKTTLAHTANVKAAVHNPLHEGMHVSDTGNPDSSLASTQERPHNFLSDAFPPGGSAAMAMEQGLNHSVTIDKPPRVPLKPTSVVSRAEAATTPRREPPQDRNVHGNDYAAFDRTHTVSASPHLDARAGSSPPSFYEVPSAEQQQLYDYKAVAGLHYASVDI
jgi:hypothetical protein